MRTEIYRNSIGTAPDVILAGGVVAVPTETVYGLAANALDSRAVERVFEAKGRPENKPVSIFVPDMSAAEHFCQDIPDEAYALAEKFWPGPLTMILIKRDNVPDVITAGGDTVGVRCPDNALTLELMDKARVPITGTSANISGQPDARDFQKVLEYFDGIIECAIDGGDSLGGVPSTVVDMTGGSPRILRQGGITKEDILKAISG